MMKITKLGHSCLLVETAERTVLFDPGIFSTVDVNSLQDLDDIFVTHEHGDHFNPDLIKELVAKFPKVQVTAPGRVGSQLSQTGIKITKNVEGVELFDAPHEGHLPFLDPPENIGIHYHGVLSNPGDSHSFTASKPILALPVTAPWGSTVDAVDLAIKLKPRYVIPVHDWMWKDQWRDQMYDWMGQVFANADITFVKPVNGEAFTLDV
jgi:L-ascorbate metabolism protein UlaG (beta-lactamase superfamily)